MTPSRSAAARPSGSCSAISSSAIPCSSCWVICGAGRVLDLACGEGVYTRQFKREGAVAVTGVDISPGMIALAEVEEQAEPLSMIPE